MRFDFDRARNPFLVPTDGRIGARDAALHCHNGRRRRPPRGRLPFVWPARIEDVGCHALGEYRHCVKTNREGPLIGQRWFDARVTKPPFPFGHGLSWTRFE
jgi:hypothetical protein